VSLNLQRRHLTSSQKATVAMDVLPMLEAEAKERQGARNDIHQLIDECSSEPHKPVPQALEQAAQMVGTNRQYVSDAKKLRDEAPELLERVRSGELTIPQAKTLLNPHQLINSSKSNEYYTPIEFIDSAYVVMGYIDLDPASCEEANKNVRAKTYYTIEEDGFSKPWSGRVWMNPPYGKDEGESEGNQARWVRKICDEYAAGNVSEACVLVNAVPGNKWFHPLWQHTICFVYRRIHFINGSGAPTHSNAIVYLGKNIAAFADEFKKHGAVVRRVYV
jgi:hypothetical protein